jgi:hypothetical protein
MNAWNRPAASHKRKQRGTQRGCSSIAHPRLSGETGKYVFALLRVVWMRACFPAIMCSSGDLTIRDGTLAKSVA